VLNARTGIFLIPANVLMGERKLERFQMQQFGSNVASRSNIKLYSTPSLPKMSSQYRTLVLHKLNLISLLSIICVLCLFCSTTYAGGSFNFKTDLEPILKQKSKLYKFILNSFDFSESGFASRIGTNVNYNLGGKRVGPYVIKAKPKYSDENYIFEVTFFTEQIFTDEIGKPSDLENATRVKEAFKSFEVKLIEK
jgi:hypothetical protein